MNTNRYTIRLEKTDLKSGESEGSFIIATVMAFFQLIQYNLLLRMLIRNAI